MHASYACIICMHIAAGHRVRERARDIRCVVKLGFFFKVGGRPRPLARPGVRLWAMREFNLCRFAAVCRCAPSFAAVCRCAPSFAAVCRCLPFSHALIAAYIYIYIYRYRFVHIYIYIYTYSFLGDTFIFHGGPGLAPATGERNWRRAPCNQVDARG